MTRSHRSAARGRRPETEQTPALDVPAPAAPVPLAGLARAVEGAGTDVMGGEAVPDQVQEVVRRRAGSGQALPRRTAQDLGDKLGADLSGVRVHADGEADTIARSVQAKAFTLGSDIYFSKGTYSPESPSGRSLLAHELTHVRQHQQGSFTSGGGMTVGRTDDPAEREAEQVARQVVAGRPVSPGAGAGAGGAVRRSPDPTIRRLFGLFGTTGVGNLREGELGSDDESVPFEFIDLADTLQAIPQLKEIDGLEYDGKAFDHDDLDTFAGGDAMGGFTGAMSTLGGVKEIAGGLMEGKDAIENLWHAYQKYDFGLGEGARGDTIGKNLGAVQMESSVTTVLTGGGNTTSGISSLMEIGGSEIPFIDVAMNGVQGTIKTKKAIEDSVASGKLGRQKTHIKREQDTFMPEDVRAERFGEFVAALKNGGKVKGSDRKRWHDFHVQWVAHAGGLTVGSYDLTAPDPDAAKAKKKPVAKPQGTTTGTGTGTPPPPTTEFNPLTTSWADATEHVEEKKVFLAFLRTVGKKDFGYGTKLRTKYEDDLKAGGARQEGSQDYEQMRDLGKMASFGQRRKAETATLNSVEALGHYADAAGTFTAAGDFGATKATGKALKAGSALYKGLKSLVKRGRRVHKLRTAKNEMEYGGKGDRGVLWGAKQFFFGNVDSQQKKARGALKAAVSQPERDEQAYQAELLAWQQKKDAYDKYVADQADYDDMKKMIMDALEMSESDFTSIFPPGPDAVADPGAQPVKRTSLTGAKDLGGGTMGKTAKVMTAEQAKPLIKKLTLQCKRKVDDLVNCLLSENETVRNRAKQIIHIVAETNLAGAIQKIDDKDLELLYKVAKQMKADPAYKAQHAVEFKRRKSALKEAVSNQLSGVGG